MPNLTLPGVSTENWGEIYNTAIEVLNAYIAGVENTFNNHNHNNTYASKEHNHETLEALIAGKSDEGHTHHLADITDMPNLNINLSTIKAQIKAHTGTSNMSSRIKIIAGLENLTDSFFAWTITVKWCHPSNINTFETETLEELSKNIYIHKPEANSVIWDENGQSVLKIQIRALNLFNSTQSIISDELSVVVSAFQGLTADDMVTALIGNQDAMNAFLFAINTNPVLVAALKTSLESSST